MTAGQWLLYEHEDGRFAAAQGGAASFADQDPRWRRVGPIQVHGERPSLDAAALEDAFNELGCLAEKMAALFRAISIDQAGKHAVTALIGSDLCRTAQARANANAAACMQVSAPLAPTDGRLTGGRPKPALALVPSGCDGGTS